MKTFQQRVSFGVKLGLTRAQAARLARLKTPSQIQDFINRIPINFEHSGETCLSVAEVLSQRRSHCIEAAFVAALALWMIGKPPLLMDMQGSDVDHVVAVFRQGKYWGAISKSNHVWHRWRDPIYRSLREMAMSYFHEYVDYYARKKTLLTYSVPFDLRRCNPKDWVTGKECWELANTLDAIRHFRLVSPAQVRQLRLRDRIERIADQLEDFKEPEKKPRKKASRKAAAHK